MKKRNRRLSLTTTEFKLLQAETAKEKQLAKIALQFFNSTTASNHLENLSPDKLAKIGKALKNPDHLLAGPNILKWQNMRRERTKASERFL